MMILRRRPLLLLGGLAVLALVLIVAVNIGSPTLRYVLTWDPVPAGQRQATPGGVAAPGTGDPGTVTTTGPTGQAKSDFFADFRLDRERTRGQQLEQLREMINNTKVDEATRRTAAAQWLALTQQIGKELELEGLIRAKGWSDCVVFVQETTCTVVVRAEKLSQAEVTRIGDIVVRGTGLPAQSISISARLS